MFSSHVFTDALALPVAVIGSLVIGFVFYRMSFSYTVMRAQRQYAQNRVAAPSIPAFSLISKFMFVTSMVLTLCSLWWSSPLLLTLYHEPVSLVAGLLLVLVGYVNLNRCFQQLGRHYSPSFDAYVPDELITAGYYRLVRHPIYLFNLFISFGLALASGSLWVMINALVGLVFLLRIIRMEERYLKMYLPGYAHYKTTTWRLIPYCY